MTPDLEEICKKAMEVTMDAGAFIRSMKAEFNESNVEHKGFNDLVSFVDKKSEQMLVDGLSKILPGSGFITEENTAGNSGEQYRWIIDPLDGTTNFVHGVPCFSVSVALQDHESTVIGIIYEINLHECFYSWLGGEAFLNGKPISVSKREKLSGCLVATGFPYTDFNRMEEYMKVFDYCMRNTRGIRRPGSAAVDLAYTACGRFDAFYEYGLHAWDVAAGAFLVQQAGGKVSDFKGGKDFLFGKEIIASNSKVNEEFLGVIADRFFH